jgi:hypothetical protein
MVPAAATLWAARRVAAAATTTTTTSSSSSSSSASSQLAVVGTAPAAATAVLRHVRMQAGSGRVGFLVRRKQLGDSGGQPFFSFRQFAKA